MKKHIILLLTIVTAMTMQAQNKVTLHMKDGSERVLNSGVTDRKLQFFDIDPEKERVSLNQQLRYRDTYVGKVWDYYTFKYYRDLLFIVKLEHTPLEISYDSTFIYVSSLPNPCAEQHDLAIDVSRIDERDSILYAFGSREGYDYLNKLHKNDWYFYMPSFQEYSLLPNHTYYYRLSRQLSYWEKGVEKTARFYSDDQTFYLPNRMGLSGLIPYSLCEDNVIYPDSLAWKQFYDTYYHGRRPTELKMGRKWCQWVEQNKSKVSISEEIQFDDGKLCLVSSIPVAFFDWLKEQDIVLNRASDIAEINYGIASDFIVFDRSTFDSIYGFKPTDMRYIKVLPESSVGNQGISFDLSDAVPDIYYQLIITYAPAIDYYEGGEFHVNENVKPSKVKAMTTVHNDSVDSEIILLTEEISPESETIWCFDSIVNIIKIDIQSKVSSRELRNNTYSREFRISEIRLTPMDKANSKVYEVVEQMPEFPGGQAALLEWIADNVIYPPVAEQNGIQGRVVCTFIVETDGSVSDVQVVRSIDPSLDAEAIRVLSNMPRWNPGKQNGEAVRVKYTVPVTFKLDRPRESKRKIK